MSTVTVTEGDLKSALSNVRSDSDPTDWCLACHDGAPNKIKLCGSGTGGLDSLLEGVTEDNVYFGLIRVTEKVEISETVKFVMLHFVGPKVPMVKKGRFGTMKGTIVDEFFSPHHVNFYDVNDKSEITVAVVQDKVAIASGTKKHEIESTEGRQVRGYGAKPTNQESSLIKDMDSKKKHVVTGVTKNAINSTAMPHSDELVQKIKSIRNDDDALQWVISSYENDDVKKPNLVVCASGNGDTGEFADAFDSGKVQYGMCRTTDTYEGIKTVKFVYVAWTGTEVSPMLRAKTSVHKGGSKDIFSPCHITLEADRKSDLAKETIDALIQGASGSQNKVLS